MAELRARLAAARSKNKRKRAADGASERAATMGEELAAQKEMSSAAAWVKRSRTAPRAAPRAEEEAAPDKADGGSDKYKSTDLEGMVIGHDVSSFKAGESVILTLADADVLDDEAGPELTNANMADAERLKFRQDRERKLKKPLYTAYDDDGSAAGDIDGMVRKPRMLAQYDQEDDEKALRERRRVAIGSGGTINPGELQEAKRIAERMRAAQQGKTLTSLHSAPLKIGRDYMTNEEVAAAASFKKKMKKKKKKDKKKKRRKRRKGLVEEDSDEEMVAASVGSRGQAGGTSGSNAEGGMSLADELEARALAAESSGQKSHGSRNSRASELSADPDFAEELKEHERQVRAFNVAMKRSWDAQKKSSMGAAGDGHGPGGGSHSNNVNDRGGSSALSSEEELAAAMRLAREQDEAREAKRKADRAAAQIGIGGVNPDEGKLVFSSTVQFTDQLKSRILQMADEQAAAEARIAARSARKTEAPADAPYEKNAADSSAESNNRDTVKAPEPTSESDVAVASSSSSSSQAPHEAAQASSGADPFARREPLASSGLAASLALLRRRNNLGDKSSGQSLAFSRTGAKSVKTEGADGGIKYEHRDSQGNLLSTKEAWRLQNYVFHGQNPGRKKMEKRKAILDAMQPRSQLDAETKQTRALRARLQHSKQAFVKLNY
eukprot:g4765.t1